MKLYLNDISSAASRVRIALAIKQIEVDVLPVSILGDDPENRREDYLRINPQGLVPALVTDQGGLITQSIAIIEYLDELHPEPPLLPKGLEQRALSRSVAIAIAAEIHALVPPRVARRLSTLPGVTAAEIADWNRHWVMEGLQAIDRLLQSHQAGPFVGGQQASLGDILLFPQTVNAERMGIDLSQWPTLAGIHTRLAGMPAFAENAPAPRT
ncbi:MULTISPECIES: maleylacetoacetate isomerase [Herbaspirillum]|uniref:maleylacetoacetate isomerase n=1 Tax=Herbaspirillum TaxID=963 RepID=UPI00160199CE|nr:MULTISPECIES: maleylacetoacetate isomerase [Herbaspirillum]MCI1013598.1 maleylacetoacetate isomerase [Herbaspirillum sp. C7C2]QNB06625.1 maleylacetoacetate isomerase [Herbaspirillum frisingense]UIN22811.1 maleylacetoacetate isomerase [Herbaspirillum frisingense]